MRAPGLLILCGLLQFACAADNPAGPSGLTSTDAFIGALRQRGATVGRVQQMPPGSFAFTVSATRLLVNGENVNVFEYATVEAAAGDAARVSPDGSTIGSTHYDWVDTARFYRGGSVIVLYVGRKPELVATLDAILGQPFAAGSPRG